LIFWSSLLKERCQPLGIEGKDEDKNTYFAYVQDLLVSLIREIKRVHNAIQVGFLTIGKSMWLDKCGRVSRTRRGYSRRSCGVGMVVIRRVGLLLSLGGACSWGSLFGRCIVLSAYYRSTRNRISHCILDKKENSPFFEEVGGPKSGGSEDDLSSCRVRFFVLVLGILMIGVLNQF
jgi:hypothetical protein